jgi:hypothetical protein
MSIKVGDLVKNRLAEASFEPNPAGIGLVVDLEEMGGTAGAWVEWIGKPNYKPIGLYWTPLKQLEHVKKGK